MLTKRQIKQSQKNGVLNRIYADEVNLRIRMRYTSGDEHALVRQKDEKPEEYQAYVEYAEACKAAVKAEINAVLENL